jgi:lauroyl/myristoyl acyltransferase
MPGHSVTDLSIAVENQQLFELICRLPTELFLEFFEKANAWEMRNDLAGRLDDHASMVRAPVASTPALADRAEAVAAECARYLFLSNAALFALVAQLERGERTPLTIEWHGLERWREATGKGRPAVVFAPHFGFLYIVPVALAVLGHRSAVLGNEVARDVISRIVPGAAPRLWELIEYILVPSPGCAAAASRALADGRHLVIFPEVNMGTTGNVRSATMPFLGRTIWVPTSTARFARLSGAAVVPMLVAPAGPRRVVIEIHEPVPAPANRGEDEATSLRLFEWLERVVLDRPQLWLGWPMLDGAMRVDQEQAQERVTAAAART